MDFIKKILVWGCLPQPQPEPPPVVPVPPPTPAPLPIPIPTGAETIVALVNIERAKKGLISLKINDKIVDAAVTYAQLMAARNVLSHTLNGDIGSRLEEAGYNWSSAGENIGWNYASPQEMVTGWMQSPGHRANILNGGYTETGVGIQDDGNGPYYCQDFGS